MVFYKNVGVALSYKYIIGLFNDEPVFILELCFFIILQKIIVLLTYNLVNMKQYHIR